MQKNVELIKNLASDNEAIKLSALESIRENGDPAVLPAVINLIVRGDSKKVTAEAIELLNDLKDKNSVPYIINSLREYRGMNGYREIVASCWQNGLDFSAHLELFTVLVLEEPLEIAMEAFTVVEENIGRLPIRQREVLAEMISVHVKTGDEIKIRLIKDLQEMVNESLRS
jgi:HEAT repeat protein